MQRRLTRWGLGTLVAAWSCGGSSPGEFAAPEPEPGQAGPPSGAVVPAELTAEIDVAASDADFEAGRFGSVFDLAEVEDLIVRVRFNEAAPIGGTAALEIWTPWVTRFNAYERAVEQREVLFVVPVAGTDIARRRLWGTYRLIVTLDAADAPVADASIELR